MKIAGYNPATGSGFHTDYSDIFAAVENKNIEFGEGRLSIDSAVVHFDKDSELVNFYDATGELQKVGYAASDDSLNASKQTADLVLSADEYSTLTAGAGNDSIFAFEGSQVDAGAGNNFVEIEAINNDSATIILSSGKTTVKNFKAGFDDGDKISIGAASYDFSFDGEKVSVKSGASRGLLQNILDDAARILTVINGKEIKTAVAQAGAIIAAGDDTADAYYGKKSGVDFTGFEDSLTVDLNENFHGINRITVGGGFNTLISSSANETLTGNGTTEFIFSKDSGRDVIRNFNFDEDKINVGNETITAVNVNSAGGVRMQISGDATLTLSDAQGKNFKINEFTALVDKNLTYNDAANYFVATSRNATLSVGEDISDAKIWLDGSHGKTFDGDIRTLDANGSTVKAELAGNDLNNTILAGNGDASLWGGNGGDDLLIGGAGKNTFFYTNGNGSDTITGANSGDVVNLAQVTLEQIASTNIAADAVSINFKDGGSLQVNSNADITYQLADGSKFSANHAQATWTAK